MKKEKENINPLKAVYCSYSIFILLLSCVLLNACYNKKKENHVSSAFAESFLKNYVISTSQIKKADALARLDSILNAASTDSAVFHQTVEFLDKPFADPNSPFRNEDIYGRLLQAEIQSPWYDSISKKAAKERLHLLMQNQPGTAANDFIYITPGGNKEKMYELKADYTLLMFYNPECNACKEMKKELEHSAVINAAEYSGELKVLAIYTDPDETVWRKHLPEIPKEWINGRDENEYLYKNNVYDLRAIPTLYLLDKDKKVLLKDCMDVGQIEATIRQAT